MCRWLAYTGAPIFLTELLFEPEHSLIDQSLASRSSDTTTNGDGFGVGWYGRREWPGVYRDISPAWNDPNLWDLADQVQSRMFLAHVRATTGGAVQATNCHPFRYEHFLFQHNGLIHQFDRLRRDLAFAISPELFRELRGTTDSEIMFFLALTFGMADDVLRGVSRMAAFVEWIGRKHDVSHPLEMTLGIADGQRIYTVRYASDGTSRTLFHSKSSAALRELNPRFSRFSDDARIVVSEPLTELLDYWEEIPECSSVVICNGHVERRPFHPSEH